MKKIMIGLVLLAVLALAAVYLFIPGKIKIEAAISLDVPFPAASRSLADENTWKKWWPGENPFIYKSQTYSVKGNHFSVFDITIDSDKDTINSQMELLPVKTTTMAILWKAEQVSSNDPFQRFKKYLHVRMVEKNMNAILQSLQTFLQKKENIYGLDIRETFVRDSALISTRRQFDHFPNVKEVDSMIQSLRRYISQNNAVEKNSPMLNVFELGKSRYEAMTAIPVEKALPKTNEFAPKFLLKGGNILEADIRGGPYTIEKGLKELENYRIDYKLNSPAIPFQLLVTDRIKEPDTTKWITRLYYPIY